MQPYSPLTESLHGTSHETAILSISHSCSSATHRLLTQNHLWLAKWLHEHRICPTVPICIGYLSLSLILFNRTLWTSLCQEIGVTDVSLPDR